MCMEKTDWERAIEFHGHSCPGLAIGYRVAKIALKELDSLRSADEELVAIVENDACGVDAVQALTGCSLGKGNLIFRDHGKQVYTLACRNSGRAVRIAVRGPARRSAPEFGELRKKVFGGIATEEEQRFYQKLQHERIQQILELPEEDFCEVRHVNLAPPPKARIFNSHPCAECGEPVMEPRARVKDGKIVCIPCAESYSRGW